MANSFFIEMEWKTRDAGFLGDFHASKLYGLDYEKERIYDDVLRLLKTRCECMITFQCFTGYQTIDLLRLVRDGNGKTMSRVLWLYGIFGNVLETMVDKDIPINKRAVSKCIVMALAMFGDIKSE